MHFTCYKYLSLRYTILISTSQTDIFNIILNINKNMSTCWNYSTRTSQHIKLQNILRISAFLIPNMLYYGHSILIGLLHVLFPISTAYIQHIISMYIKYLFTLKCLLCCFHDLDFQEYLLKCEMWFPYYLTEPMHISIA